MRVVVGEDSVLLREGIARLLEDAGFEVVGQAGDADELLRKVRAHKPDVAVIDIRMPPNHSDEGVRAARQVRALLPKVGILVLSQYVDEHYALALLSDGAEGIGYLLKDRVGKVDRFVDAARRVAAGGLGPRPGGRGPHGRTPRPGRPGCRSHPARARRARADGPGTLQQGNP